MLGNEKIIEQLSRRASEGKLSHAYLITGEKGLGKKTLAKQIGVEVFCRNKQGQKACLKCPECKKVLSGNHPDMVWVTHEKPQLVSVDEIREQVCDEALIRPYEGGRKLIVIDEAEKMNAQAQNALLKTLEEPPAYLTILLLCADSHVLSDTILSRCEKIRLQRVDTETIRDHLLHQEHTEETIADTAAVFSSGNPGRAVDLACSDEFQAVYHETVELCKKIKDMDAAEINAAAKRVLEADPLLTLELIESWIRDVICFRINGDPQKLSFQKELSAIRKQADTLSPAAASGLLSQVQLAIRRLGANVNKELTMNLLFLAMKELS